MQWYGKTSNTIIIPKYKTVKQDVQYTTICVIKEGKNTKYFYLPGRNARRIHQKQYRQRWEKADGFRMDQVQHPFHFRYFIYTVPNSHPSPHIPATAPCLVDSISSFKSQLQIAATQKVFPLPANQVTTSLPLILTMYYFFRVYYCLTSSEHLQCCIYIFVCYL